MSSSYLKGQILRLNFFKDVELVAVRFEFSTFGENLIYRLEDARITRTSYRARFWPRQVIPGRVTAKFKKRPLYTEQKIYFILFKLFVDHMFKYCSGIFV